MHWRACKRRLVARGKMSVQTHRCAECANAASCAGKGGGGGACERVPLHSEHGGVCLLTLSDWRVCKCKHLPVHKCLRERASASPFTNKMGSVQNPPPKERQPPLPLHTQPAACKRIPVHEGVCKSGQGGRGLAQPRALLARSCDRSLPAGHEGAEGGPGRGAAELQPPGRGEFTRVCEGTTTTSCRQDPSVRPPRTALVQNPTRGRYGDSGRHPTPVSHPHVCHTPVSHYSVTCRGPTEGSHHSFTPHGPILGSHEVPL